MANSEYWRFEMQSGTHRIVFEGENVAAIERLIGHDLLGGERWDETDVDASQLLTRLAG